MLKIKLQIILYSLILLLVTILNSCKKQQVFKTYDKPEVTINSDNPRLSDNIIHFVKDTVYILAANLNRYAGQVLKIDEGTLIKVEDGLSITINPGARIEAKGTSAQPIVFTSSAYKGSAGFTGYGSTTEHSWFGISILGNYPGNIDSTSAGTGIISYVRIEFAGAGKDNYNQVPPLLLQNIGRGTVVENIQVSYSVTTNSFQISGGNFNGRNLVSYASGGSDFVVTDGYSGMLQNLLAYRHPFFSPQISFAGPTLAGLLISGSETCPSVSNVTVLGPDVQTGTNPKYFDTTKPGPFGSLYGSMVAALVVTGGKFHIRNSVFMSFPKTGFYLADYNSASSLLDSTSDFKYSIVHCNDIKRGFYISSNVSPPYTSDDFKNFMLQEKFNNQLFFNSSQLMLADPFHYDLTPNPFPKSGSLLLTGANFDGPVFNNPFFEKVSYRGALGNNNWLQGWTNFIPLQTNYNN